jgi:hypothetical protein
LVLQGREILLEACAAADSALPLQLALQGLPALLARIRFDDRDRRRRLRFAIGLRSLLVRWQRFRWRLWFRFFRIKTTAAAAVLSLPCPGVVPVPGGGGYDI